MTNATTGVPPVVSKHSKFIAAAVPLFFVVLTHYGIELGDNWVGDVERVLDEILLLATPIIVYFAPKNSE